MRPFHHIGVIGTFGGIMMVVVGVLVGANAGLTAETEADLTLTDDIDISDADLKPEEMATDPLTKWQMEQVEENERVNSAVTEHIVRPAVYGTMNYVAEPAARFSYHNQWIPVQFWQAIGYLGALVPLGFAGYQLRRYLHV